MSAKSSASTRAYRADAKSLEITPWCSQAFLVKAGVPPEGPFPTVRPTGKSWLADLWPLTMKPLRSPAQYQSQQQSPCTTTNGQPIPRRVQKQALAVGEGSDDLIWCTPKPMQKKSGRESLFGRRAGGPVAPDRRYGAYFCILQAPAEYKNDLGISG